MAHQMVSELYHVNDGHGRFFQIACNRLRIAFWARKAQMSFHGIKSAQGNSPISEFEKNLMRKAKKLLALAGSNNEHEAFLAMKKVQDLYEKYHLQLLVREEIAEYQGVIIGHKKKRIETYQSMIAALLVRHFYVQIIHTSRFDAEKCEELKVLEVWGTSQHVKMAGLKKI